MVHRSAAPVIPSGHKCVQTCSCQGVSYPKGCCICKWALVGLFQLYLGFLNLQMTFRCAVVSLLGMFQVHLQTNLSILATRYQYLILKQLKFLSGFYVQVSNIANLAGYLSFVLTVSILTHLHSADFKINTPEFDLHTKCRFKLLQILTNLLSTGFKYSTS